MSASRRDGGVLAGQIPVRIRRLVVLVPVVSTVWVWRSLREQFFQFDDFVHLYDVATLPLGDLVGSTWCGHLLVLYVLIFWSLFYLFGADPAPYFALTIITHALNAALLFQVIRAFGASTLVACAGAVWWATSPVLTATLAWFSVYGQVALTTIALGVLWSLARRAGAVQPMGPASALFWTAALAAGSTAFGMGLGLVAALPLALVLIAAPGTVPARTIVVTTAAAAVTIAGYLAVSGWLRPMPLELPGCSPRDGMSPTMALGAIELQLLLASAGAAALLFDLTSIARPFTPWVHALGGATIAAQALAACTSVSTRRRSLGIFVLLGGVYFAIAAGRVALFQALGVPLAAAASEPRYQYLPGALFGLLFCIALTAVARRIPTSSHAVTAVVTILLVVRMGFAILRPHPIGLAQDSRAHVSAVLANVRARAAAVPPGETAVVPNRPFGLSTVFPQLMPGEAAIFLLFSKENAVDGRPVRFRVSAEDWKRAQERGGRIAELLVPE